MQHDARRLVCYASRETHTWIQKAADITGLGTDAIRWIGTDEQQRIRLGELEKQIVADLAAGDLPFLVVGTAGNVSTGAIDPLGDIAALCRERDLWFHVDGAYGAPAAALDDSPDALKALAEADSLALDPHKWLYTPLEAAATLVRDPDALTDTFRYEPPYYNLESRDADAGVPGKNYFAHGLQNSRGFRALKVWLGLRHVGLDGVRRMLREDIALARCLFELMQRDDRFRAGTHNLSIATFRFAPPGLGDGPACEAYVDDLNRELANVLQAGGEAYISNAIIEGRYYLRACVVNFRTTLADIEALPDIIARAGATLDARLRPDTLAG